ncbi:hypothetical protein [Galbibacter sp. BG1]
MPDYKKIKEKLNSALAEREKAKQELYLKEEKFKQLKGQKEKLERGFDKSRSTDVSRKAALEKQVKSLSKKIVKQRIIYQKREDHLDSIIEQSRRFSDPREHITRMKDQHPFLLLPLRIETRFKKESADGTLLNQLWVRIYPDDVAIDSFEETLSKEELESAREYWLGIWQAGEREAMERTAWRGLVSSYGSGRARYIREQYIPINQAEIPKNTKPNQLYLTIGVEKLPPSTDISAIKKFWKTYWLAGYHQKKQAEAHYNLVQNLSGSKQENKKRAEEIKKTLKPSNFDDFSRLSEDGLEVSVIFVQLREKDSYHTKEQSWSQAPKTNVLPDRFVITGYNTNSHSNDDISFQEIGNIIPSPLIMGPDPSLNEREQLKQKKGDLIVNKDIQWMVNFDQAVKKGMGFKINLTDRQMERGFDRIVVLGLKLDPDASNSTSTMETLFKNHERSKKGLAILPQGTPTNNTDNQDSGYSYFEDADVSYDHLKKDKQFEPESDWMLKKDGQWLAEWLGLDQDTFQRTYNADLTDQTEAKAMNTALFPATLGYMMESLMSNVFNDQDVGGQHVEKTRWFLNNFVSGRGPIPALKIGRQPYGILPTTKWNDMRWIPEENPRTDETPSTDEIPHPEGIPWEKDNEIFIYKLYKTLKQIDKDWQPLMEDVAYVGKEGGSSLDAHQLLLDIIGLTPNSIEYYQRYAESESAIINRLRLMGFPSQLMARITEYPNDGMNLLKGFNPLLKDIPEILKKFFLQSENKLFKALIDDKDLSETEPIRSYTTDGENYIKWLIKAAKNSHNTLREQKGFIDVEVPSTLLYLMLKHALDIGYINTSLDLNLQAGILDSAKYKRAKMDHEFLHEKTEPEKTESRWRYLYEKNPTITGDDSTLGDFIGTKIDTELSKSYLKRQLDALKHLENVPTARLERALTEHIDLCTYRLDAWKNGLMNYQLATMRFRGAADPENSSRYPTGEGTYLGAYGWLEDIRPENKRLTPKNLTDPQLKKHFNHADEPQLVTDDTNGGYIGTPSLNHAVTTAILRNAYMAQDNPETFEINLSSERVRKALSIIEGIRAGQNLSAMLGYYFERELHDQNHNLEKIDYFIHKLRKAFPLNSDKIKSTKTKDTDPIEAIEASNVVDGLALINHVKRSGIKTYPFGNSVLKSSGSDEPSQEIKSAINEQVLNIMNINDAVADVAMAESVHQVVLGNYDRAAATLDTYSKGNFPPIPDVVQTPRSGTNITQRFGLQFETGVNANTFDNPRSKAEPAIAKWLKDVLPNQDIVATKAVILYHDDTEQEIEISQADLKLESLDLLYMVNTDNDQTMTALDDHIEKYVRDKHSPRPDAEVKIKYTERIPDKINFFELAAQMNSLRNLLLQSRPLQPMDVSIPLEAKSAENDSIFLDETRITNAKTGLGDIIDEVDTYLAALSALTTDTEANKTQLLNTFDDLTGNLLAILSEMGSYGLPQSGTGFVYEKKRVIYSALFEQVEELISRWDEQLDTFTSLIGDYEAATTEEERFTILYKAERSITTLAETPQPDTASEFRNKLDQKRTNFDTKLQQFKNIVTANHPKVSDLLQAITSALPIADFDFNEYSTLEQEEAMLRFTAEMETLAQALKADLSKRTEKVQEQVKDASLLSSGKKRVELVQKAGKTIFGEDFKMVPEFTLPEKQADEWANSEKNTDQLLDHLKNTENRDFPVDEWVYSLARVREKVHHWENVVNLKEAFTDESLDLKPVQLPYMPNDTWLAFDFPETYEISNDKILYTAHYPDRWTLNEKSRQCGLLLDEWTEVIPSKKEDVGVTFHYDKPNSEPPQVILLAMPSEFTGSWQWNNLLDIVNDTLDQAKKRALEPQQIDKTDYARFLPATVSSVVKHPISASLNYAFNNLLFDNLNDVNNE